MPDLDWNAETWDGAYDWENGGEEWSQAWGGSEAQWFGSLYPRLHRFLPAGRVLEIAPGYGRWTKFLIGLSESFVGVDLSDQCVAACKTRFAASRHASFLKTDGTSLAMTEGKFDFVFSFDSLVHAEFEIMQAYIREILARLNPGGLAFLHHSNFLDCQGVNTHRRAGSVSAGNVAACIRENGGSVLLQEKVNWGSVELTDSLTLFGQAVCFPGETIRLANGSFMDEAHIIKAFQSFYGAPLQTQALVRRNSGGGAFSVVADSALRRSEARAAEAEALLRDCEGRLAAMEASTFWRTSSPFRSYLAANPRMRTAMKQVLQPVWRGLRRLR